MGLAQTRRPSWWWVALGVIPGSYSVLAAEPTEIEPTTSHAATTHIESSTLLPSERVRAQAWSLSEQEWRRYTTLMQGLRGSISPATISPIEVLGIHARDEAERRRYAERWARLMREDVDRILAFQRAYDEAGRRLFPGEPLIDPSRLPRPSAGGDALAPADRVLFFTRTECPRCDAVLARVLARRERVAGIDIYLAGVASGDEQAVRDWAAAHGIRAEWVRSRRVTLNFDEGTLEKLTGGVAELPYLMRRRGEDVAVLPASAL